MPSPLSHAGFETLLPMTLAGLSSRTDNVAEQNPVKAKIGPAIQRYFQDNIPQKLENRVAPGVTYSVFTDYESDFTGAYTHLFGEAVKGSKSQAEGLTVHHIPQQTCAVFDVGPGPMPDIIIQAWQQIWAMEKEGRFPGQRSYIADFGRHDAAAADPQNARFKIYIGVQNHN